jgi:nitric oxide reductase subunit C
MLSSMKRLVILMIILGLSACSNSSAAENSLPDPATLNNGDAAAGQAAFASNGCVACHAVEADAPPGIGPSLVGVAGRSRETIQSPDYTGQADTVEAYLWESIIHPQAHIIEGHMTTMPATYQQSLEEQEIADLVAYLLTL